MKYHKYVAYIFTDEEPWMVRSNNTEHARKFANDLSAGSYALLYNYELKGTDDVPAGYVSEGGGSWRRLPHWTDAIPEKFKPDDGCMLALHRMMEDISVKAEVNYNN